MTYEWQFSFLCDDFKQTYPSQRKLFQKSLLLSKETNKDFQTYLTCPSNFFGSVFNCYKDQRSREHWRPPDWKHSKNFKCKWQKRPPRLVPTQVRAAQIWCGKYRPKSLEWKVLWIKKVHKAQKGLGAFLHRMLQWEQNENISSESYWVKKRPFLNWENNIQGGSAS